MVRLALLVLVAMLGGPLAAQDLSVPRAFHGFGDPSALAVNAAQTRAYVGESAGVAVLDVTTLVVPMPAPAVLARIPVDASVIALTLDEVHQRLFVAGGSFGLLSIDLASPSLPVTARDDVGDLVCFEVVSSASHVIAVFGAQNGSLLRVYDRSTLALVGSTPLGNGTAFAVALDGAFAYVAMGTGGLTRVDLTNPAAGVVQPGPVFPVAVFGEPARARDIAIVNGRIYAAVDGLGLVAMRTSLPWGPATPFAVTALTGPAPGAATATLYAHRVAVDGIRIYVGANRVAGREADGGPFTAFGPMDYALAVGGVTTPSPVASSDALFVFEQGATALTQLQRVDVDGAWRELVARATRVWEVHAFAGFFARTTAVPLALLGSHHGDTYQPAEALLSLRDPDLVISGQDGAGSHFAGLLDIGDPDAIAAVPVTSGQGSYGLWFDAQWLDANPGREWFVGNGEDDWRLYRFDHTQPGQTAAWTVASPDDPQPGFNNGRNYWLSWLDGDLLLLTRAGTRWGFVGYSKSALQAAAATAPLGSLLPTAPLWQLETHFSGEVDQAQTWRCRTFSLPSGQRIAAIAAGYHTAPGPNATRPQIVLYDVSAGTLAPPVFLTRIVGPNLEGNAMAVATERIGLVTYLFVADFGFGLHVYDVSNPLVPVLAGGWQCPANVFDGHVDHATDVELHRATDGHLYAYLTVWRRGLVRLDVTNPASFVIPVVSEHDTPGLPYGIAIRDVAGGEGIVLADHQAGLRLYGQYSSWRPYGAGCVGAAGTPSLQLATPPVIGTTFTLAVSNLAGGLAAMVAGFGAISAPLQPLGLGFGPACTLLATPDVLEVMPQAGGAATWSLAIPSTPSLRGIHLFNQAVELGTPSSASNAGGAKID